MKGVDCWVVDALRYTHHPTHANVETALKWIARVKPKHAVLTNLHLDLDYETLKAQLPPGVEPAYDGMVLTVPIRRRRSSPQPDAGALWAPAHRDRHRYFDLSVADEVRDVVVELLQRRQVHIDHVAGLVIAVLDILLQRRRDRHVVHLEPAFVIGRRDIEIAAIDHDLQVRIVLHRRGEVGQHIGQRDQRLAGAGRLVLVVPAAIDIDAGL